MNEMLPKQINLTRDTLHCEETESMLPKTQPSSTQLSWLSKITKIYDVSRLRPMGTTVIDTFFPGSQ